MISFVKNFLRFRALKRLYARHERLMVPGMLLIGVLVDVLTFRTISVSTAFIVLGVYAVIAGVMIALMHWYDSGKRLIEKPTALGYVRLVAPLIVQFTFGALLSASLIFYWFSGAFTVSWPLILALIILIGANDVFREHYLKPIVQLSVYYFILFSVLSVALPFVYNSVSPWAFGSAGLGSLLLVAVYVAILFRLRPDLRHLQPHPAIPIMIIFAVMNGLYFFNVIPPIPLSLTDTGIYHSVERSGGGYTVLAEQESLLEQILPGQTIHAYAGERVYVYASIFAPVDLDTTVVHHWQHYIDGEGWVSINASSYGISGGRADGYRGYSYLTGHSPGKWRVDVETVRGQVIGRIRFSIEETDEPVIVKNLTK
ncbi:MAG: DUF2914 domain-containing protein [Parcubacteria group bacterium]|nr:DUF2914 domain-containing protein [Parcubacteria group bacterium]